MEKGKGSTDAEVTSLMHITALQRLTQFLGQPVDVENSRIHRTYCASLSQAMALQFVEKQLTESRRRCLLDDCTLSTSYTVDVLQGG